MMTEDNNLIDYVISRTVRGECHCGKCIDRGDAPEPTGHTVRTPFFAVGLSDVPADKATFERLVRAHHGEFIDIDPFVSYPYSFVEIGAWVGDQGIALQCMALGDMLGSWVMFNSPQNAIIIHFTDPKLGELRRQEWDAAVAAATS